MKNKKSNKITDQEIRDLVIARLRSLSGGRRISIGSDGDFSKDELVKKVMAKDEIGKKIIAIQLNYLKSFRNPAFFDN